MREIEFKPEANHQIIEAYDYYEQQQEGLGESFLLQIELYFDKIRQRPFSYEMKRKPYRQVFIQKFPYLIIYQVIEEKVVIYSIFHAHQDPKKKPR